MKLIFFAQCYQGMIRQRTYERVNSVFKIYGFKFMYIALRNLFHNEEQSILGKKW
jgi:hypothetical protein